MVQDEENERTEGLTCGTKVRLKEVGSLHTKQVVQNQN